MRRANTPTCACPSILRWSPGEIILRKGVWGIMQPVMGPVFDTRHLGDILLSTGKKLKDPEDVSLGRLLPDDAVFMGAERKKASPEHAL